MTYEYLEGELNEREAKMKAMRERQEADQMAMAEKHDGAILANSTCKVIITVTGLSDMEQSDMSLTFLCALQCRLKKLDISCHTMIKDLSPLSQCPDLEELWIYGLTQIERIEL